MENIPSNAPWVKPPPARATAAYGVNEWYLFRNKLQVVDVAAAIAQIAVDSKYWLYVNGKLVVREGGLKRGPLPEGSYFDRVDLSAHLQPGENTVAILLWYFGKHGFSHRDSGVPGLLFQVANGTLAQPWRVMRHPAYFDAGYLHDAYRLSESSVGFDARLDIGDWTAVEFDDSDWAEALAAGTAGCAPWGALEPRDFPQWFWSEAKDYLQVEKVDCDFNDGYCHYRCKLPHNAHFVPIIEVESVAGIRLDIHVAMDTNRLCSTYITRNGRQAHEFEAWLSGEEVIYRVPSDAVRVVRLQYRETSFPSHFAGNFRCDDALLNELWLKSRRTLLVTMRDTFMDCPCRERAQWPGDMVVQLVQIPYCLDRTADLLVRKGLRETLRWQRPDGVIYGPVPEGNWKFELPAQMLALVSPYGIWAYYMFSGDDATLAELYPYAKRYMDIWQLQDNGLIRYRPEERGLLPERKGDAGMGIWDWIDWGEDIDAEPCLNAWYVLAAMALAQMADALGKTADAAEMSARQRRVTEAMRRHYWDEQLGAYLSPGFVAGPDDRVQALVVLAEVATADQYAALTHQLCTVHRACPYMEKYVLEALFRMGRVAEAIERMRSRYRTLVENNYSTLWERWPEHSAHPGTVNHSWSGGPLNLLSEIVAGIRPLEPGWQRFAIAPRPGPLRELEATVVTAHGEIFMAAVLQDNTWQVRLRIPQGTSACPDFSALGSGCCAEELPAGEWQGEFTLQAAAIPDVSLH